MNIKLSTTIIFIVTVFAVGFFGLLATIPLDGSIAERGLVKGSLSAATYRNASSMLLRIPLFAVLLLLLGVFKASFAIAAACVFGAFLIAILFMRKRG